ncbi:MAG: ubiquinone/menaquinone biosynthesis methyltransferase [Acidobacteriota bacterium]
MKKGIQKIYEDVAPTYELINHVLTFGLDILWRKRAARKAGRLVKTHNSGSSQTPRLLDVCSGTGEMARDLAAHMIGRTERKAEIYAADGSFHMIHLAKDKKDLRRVPFTLADAGNLPFPDQFFDLVTISFSTRNLNPNPQVMLSYLKEFNRILKPGGYFLNLETSQPPLKIIRNFYHLYIRFVVKHVGYFISGSKAGYKYLSYTMPRFYDAQGFSSLCLKAGFSFVQHRLFFLGVAALHTAQKS